MSDKTVRVSLLGAADGVTGSRTLVEWQKQKWLIDCGLFQGPRDVRQRNREPFPISPERLSAVILTHAHLDHTGYLPVLCREGYKGAIHCSQGTADLFDILLRDAAYLEEEFARYANETRYSHHVPAIPLFTTSDAERALKQFQPHGRNSWFELADGVSYRFLRAGHIIGASFVQLRVDTGYREHILTFSGDVGHHHSFILRGPEQGLETDFLLIESTYGDRLHPHKSVLDEFAEIYCKTMNRGGVLVIPAFAVGRAQEVIYMIHLLEQQERIPKVPVVLDSPMAVAAMEVCLNHEEDRHGARADGEEFRPSQFEIATTPDISMLTCMRSGPMAVISASGMLSGGRILHHLKARLPDERNTVLFCGFQAEGTKGRFLQEQGQGAQGFRVHHREVEVAAEIATINALSAHADRDELLEWIGSMHRLPKNIMINHGSPESQAALAAAIQQRFGAAQIQVASKEPRLVIHL